MRALLLVALCAFPLKADLTAVMAEPNLEKRSQAALVYASQALADSRKAYSAGEVEKASTMLEDVEKAVLLAETSLIDSKKDANRNPRYFKNGEIKTGELLRRLDAFSLDMNIADRPAADKVKETVQQVHDRLLTSIMTRKKK